MILQSWLLIAIAATVFARDIPRCQHSVALPMAALSLIQSVNAYSDQLSSPQSGRAPLIPRKKYKSYDRFSVCDSERRYLFGNDNAEECPEENERYRNVHGIIMAAVVLILFPVGALSMRLLGRWWLHAGFQVLSLLLLIAGFGIGIYLAKIGHKLFNNAHTILGTIVVVLFATAQPLLGFLQHSFFRRNKRRGLWGHAHLWLGRILIILGVVNGGLGLQLVDEDEGDGKWRNIYIGIAIAMAVIYVIIVVGTFLFKRRRLAKQGSYER